MRLDEIELGRWGRRIGETAETPVVIALRGTLGAGKSALARAIGAGAGVSETMPSPSYNILLRYTTDSGTEVVHLDLYRLDAPDELWELGWSQLGADNEIVLIEWPERAGDLMPRDHWLIELTVPDDEPELRDIEVHRVGHPSELASFPLSVSTRG
jgi:tRNA threonylcarbamoyladenosine biosynthesis protein TsaE